MLIELYYRSPRWQGIGSDSTKRVYFNIIERFRAEHGHRLVADTTVDDIDRVLSRLAKSPTVANRLRKLLIALFDYAMKKGMTDNNTAFHSDKFKVKTKGFHSWTDDEIEAFEKAHPIGTKPRLALSLLLYTAQRRSDVVRIRPADIRNGTLSVTQQKTGKAMRIPIHPALSEAIAAGPVGQTTIIESERGSFTSASFGNWFRKQCNAAGLKHCSAHGLRKAMSRRLAEKGVSNQAIKAFGGWSGDKEVALYTRAADQALLAEAALAALLRGDDNA